MVMTIALRGRRLRLATKVQLIVGMLVIVSFAAFAYFFSKQLYTNAVSHFRTSADISCANLAEALKVPLWNFDSKEIKRLLTSAKGMPGFIQATIHLPDYPRTVVTADTGVQDADTVVTHDVTYNKRGELLRLATLEIAFSLKETEQEVARTTQNLGYLCLGLLVVVIAILDIAVNMVTRPLRGIQGAIGSLVQTMEPITDPRLLRKDEIGEVGHTFNTMVTELSAAQRALMRAKNDAERANAAKSEFLTNITHELRTPMHAIFNYTQMAEDAAKQLDPPHEKLIKFTSRILQSSQRLLRLINDLLDLSRVEAGKMQFNFAPVTLQSSIDQALAEVQSLLHAKNLQLQKKMVSGDVSIQADRERMVQVLVNLLGNACKFTPEGKTITLSVAPATLQNGEEAITCTIEDQGVGIPEDELESIFDKFTQSSKTKTGAGGTGLGLAISREIIKAHHGTMVANNRPEGGASVGFTLPVIRQPT
jgi:signal transduction histidine kinase